MLPSPEARGGRHNLHVEPDGYGWTGPPLTHHRRLGDIGRDSALLGAATGRPPRNRRTVGPCVAGRWSADGFRSSQVASGGACRRVTPICRVIRSSTTVQHPLLLCHQARRSRRDVAPRSFPSHFLLNLLFSILFSIFLRDTVKHGPGPGMSPLTAPAFRAVRP